MSDFEKKVRVQNITFWLILLREKDIYCAFLKGMISNRKLYNVSDFEFKKNTTRQNLNANFSSCQILKEKF